MSAGIRDAISKLSLKKGDILIVSDSWVMRTITQMKPPDGMDFHVPIIYAEDCDIKTVGRKQLEDALKLLDADQ